ncbi:hypothetical protein KWH04_15925 [Xanthomonas campestris pv. trichodesmae]|uniref:Uncharacterized protein n=4 Tax=Xanthomonas TaxID=338 RepID=A0AB33CP33_XANCI|nr:MULTISPECIES: hypothetical protein [Xanthomonas]MBV6782099.1 hypothetical protein [Xanthomonas campestris pv. trichodesmae]ASK92651.1 hypothetical protein XcvCFBP7111P_15140 [Xanthomonas citri pv. vignicola]MBZ3920413.1 hypothetical protein [Xanthomonas campestris pv. trichodesmae]MBZ3923818.1 hypothetical protein [Xanthomonas citri pv. sesbaniae]OOW71458.1 hypothetical protein Xmlh_08265 [Xanthomonas axonopodis pv. melhusii]
MSEDLISDQPAPQPRRMKQPTKDVLRANLRSNAQQLIDLRAEHQQFRASWCWPLYVWTQRLRTALGRTGKGQA